jgi:hypothetical protein
MKRARQAERQIAALDLTACPLGAVLEPMLPPDPATDAIFAGWGAPLATWGGFGLRSGLEVVEDGGRRVLQTGAQERSLVTLPPSSRDVHIRATLRPLEAAAGPHNDRHDCTAAYVGIVFRQRDSRHFYLWAIEGLARLVLYRRADDEWRPLAQQEVTLPDGYVTLCVDLDGDGLTCSCPELSVTLTATDTSFPTGRAGFRALGRARLAGLRVTQTPSEEAADLRRAALGRERLARRSAAVPEPVLVRRMDLSTLGTVPRRGLTYAPMGEPFFADFHTPGRYDMLIPGQTLRAMTAEGQLLWELDLPVDRLDNWPDQRLAVYSREHTDQGRWIYGMTGERARNASARSDGLHGEWVINDEMIIIAGASGQILARAPLPPLDPELRYADFSRTSANLTGHGRDIILREWRRDAGGSGFALWAYDEHLRPLWQQRTRLAYGHHDGLMVYDVDGDGRDEVLAGGTLFDAAGNVLWEHDRMDEVARIRGAEHYDAVLVGHLADDPAVDPVAFLLAGSAGVYVVDALTGRTRMVHRVGHAQFRVAGRWRADLPGRQVLVCNRWGNMGILTLFSGRGDRLWTIQPDYIGEGCFPVRWGAGDTDLLWVNTSGPAQALYDGYGCLVRELPALTEVWGRRMRNQVQRSVVRMGSDPRQLLTLTVDGVLHAWAPAW